MANSKPLFYILRISVFKFVGWILIWETIIFLFHMCAHYCAENLMENPLVFEHYIETVVFSVVHVFGLLWIFLHWYNTRYMITNHEVIMFKGIMNKSKQMFLIKNMERVESNRSFFGLIFNYGNIRLSAPTIREVIYLRSIPNPRKYVKVFEILLRRKRKTGDKIIATGGE